VKNGVTEHQEFGQCSRMPVILSQRILEPPFFAKQNSRPFCILLASENPSIYIFRLYHKDSESRDDDIVPFAVGTMMSSNRVYRFLSKEPASNEDTVCSPTQPRAVERKLINGEAKHFTRRFGG